MPFQVDVFPVGDKSTSGDAIALRFGRFDTGRRDDQFVTVIDGGFLETGQTVVRHIREVYRTDTVDAVISTHPDADHASGLEPVMTDLRVGALYMHQPWNHTEDIARMFTDGRVSDDSVAAGIRESLQDVRDLETTARRRGIPIIEPFTDVALGLNEQNKIMVVGPTLAYYESLLPEFRCTPAARNQGLVAAVRRILEQGKELALSVAEQLHIETLQDPIEETHAENNSSVVSVVRSDGQDMLFTADAGIAALTNVLDLLDSRGYDMSNFQFIQVPHHGSKRNVGPTLLDRLLGPRLNSDVELKKAFLSASKEGEPKHPSLRVLNAFRRRGARVYRPNTGLFLYHSNAPRDGYLTAQPAPFFSQVEE